MMIYHGAIVTCDAQNNIYQYLIEDKGRIVFIGNDLPKEYMNIPGVVELGEKALLPAFGEGHIHFSNWAVFNSTFDVRDAKSIDDIGKIIQAYSKRDRKAKVLFGFGHSKHTLPEKRLITKAELDKFEHERPVYIVCYDGHSAVMNSKAIELIPENIRQLNGFHTDLGQIFHEGFLKSTDYVSAQIPPLSLLNYISKSLNTLAERGIGLVHAVEGVGFPKDMDVDLVRLLSKKSDVKFRIFFQTMAVEKVLKRKLPRIGGCFSCALDGCFGAQDAALLQPYTNDPNNKGILYYPDETVIEFVKKANRANLQIELHAIGDAAVEQALKAFEAALLDYPRVDHRHTIIHACLLPPNALDRCVKNNISITLQPSFLISPLEPESYLKEILGNRVQTGSPMKTIINKGIMLSGGSDGPVTQPDPIEGIYGACNYSVPGQSVSIAEALRMYTYNVAWTSFDEKERGSLEIGKIADMVILNKNPLVMDPKDLRSLKVEKTIFNGKSFKPVSKLISRIFKSIF